MAESVLPGATTTAFIWTPAAGSTFAPLAKFGTRSVTCQPAPVPESSITVNGAIAALVSCGVPFIVTLAKFPTVGNTAPVATAVSNRGPAPALIVNPGVLLLLN